MKATQGVLALALNWDGSRAPVRGLTPAIKKFLGTNVAPPRKKLAQLFAADQIHEIRVCWLPQLRGGDDILCGPFSAPSGKRVAFRLTRSVQLGEALGAVYRR